MSLWKYLHPFIYSIIWGMNFAFELSNYWAFSLVNVHVACKLQSVVVRITASLSYLSWLKRLLYSLVPGTWQISEATTRSVTGNGQMLKLTHVHTPERQISDLWNARCRQLLPTPFYWSCNGEQSTKYPADVKRLECSWYNSISPMINYVC